MDEARPQPTSNKRGIASRRAWRWWCRWLGVTACILIAALWVVSGWWNFGWQTTINGWITPVLRLSCGQIWIDWPQPNAIIAGHEGFFVSPPYQAFAMNWRLWPTYADSGWTRSITIPLVLPLLAILLVSWRLGVIEERRGCSGRCMQCGYDLTGNVTGLCPECGTATNPRPHTAP